VLRARPGVEALRGRGRRGVEGIRWGIPKGHVNCGGLQAFVENSPSNPIYYSAEDGIWNHSGTTNISFVTTSSSGVLAIAFTHKGGGVRERGRTGARACEGVHGALAFAFTREGGGVRGRGRTGARARAWAWAWAAEGRTGASAWAGDGMQGRGDGVRWGPWGDSGWFGMSIQHLAFEVSKVQGACDDGCSP